MLIGIDCRLWKQTGVGRYTQNLVENLSIQDTKNSYVLFARDQDIESVKKAISKNFEIITCNIKWHSLNEQIKFSAFLNSYNLDLMHFPYFSVPFLYRKKYVVTVHDFIINKFNTGVASTLPVPLYLIKRLGYKLVIKNALSKSLKIIVPSIAVKEDLLSFYKDIPASKIEVTYEGGVEINSKLESVNKYGKYLLRIGNFYPHKNLENLLTAFKDIQDKEIKLVLVGKKDFFYKKVEDKIKELNIFNRIVFLENQRDSELYSLYKHALATIVPSFMEGFSLTAVEAMSLGCPLLLSDIPVHREICRKTAIYFNPADVTDIKTAIDKFIALSDKQKEILYNSEIKLSREYSWKKMAAQTLKVYESSTSQSSV